MYVIKKFVAHDGAIIGYQLGHYDPSNNNKFVTLFMYYVRTDDAPLDKATSMCSYLNGGEMPKWM